MQGADIPSFGHEPIGGYTTKPVTHGRCDGRPTVTFPGAEHNHPLPANEVYCLVFGNEAHNHCVVVAS